MRWLVVFAFAACGRLEFGEQRLADAVTGHDEDHDGALDTVDNCPNLANPMQEDSDHDGVGDICDPHRDLPIDSIAAFYSFETDLGDFRIDQGSITFADDDAIFDGSNNTGANIIGPTISDAETVTAGVTITSNDAGRRQFDLAFGRGEGSGQQGLFYCELVGAPGDSHFGYTYTLDYSNYNIDARVTAPPLSPGDLVLAIQSEAGMATCTTTWPATQQVLTGGIPAFTADNLQLNVTGIVAHVHWLLHVHSS